MPAKLRMTEHEIIRRQLETNVQDGFCGPSTIDVVINDQWETLPCKYNDGTFTVTRGGETFTYRITITQVDTSHS